MRYTSQGIKGLPPSQGVQLNAASRHMNGLSHCAFLSNPPMDMLRDRLLGPSPDAPAYNPFTKPHPHFGWAIYPVQGFNARLNGIAWTNVSTYSMAAWVALVSTSGTGVVYDTAEGASKLHTPDGTSVRFEDARWSGSGGIWTWSNILSADYQPMHLLVTYLGLATTDVPLLYVNGVQQVAATITSGPSGGRQSRVETPVYGDRPTASTAWDGWIKDVRFWSRILTPPEAWTLFDPASRWDLYRRSVTRAHFDFSAVAEQLYPFFTTIGGRQYN